MRHSLRLLAALLILMGLSACKPRQPLEEGTVRTASLSEIKDQSRSHQLQFSVASFKGKATLMDLGKGTSIDFTYRIDLARDSIMLVSISKFGIPAATTLLGQDSIWMRIPFNKTAAKCDYSLLESTLKLDLGFHSAQELLLGEPDLDLATELLESKGRTHVVKGRRGPYEVYWNLYGNQCRLEKMAIEDPILHTKSEILYEDFKKVGTQFVAHSVTVDATRSQLLRIELHHSAIALDKEQVNFNFRIPESYELVPCDRVGKQ